MLGNEGSQNHSQEWQFQGVNVPENFCS